MRSRKKNKIPELRDYSEKYFISKIIKRLQPGIPDFVKLPPGDDCALFLFKKREAILSTVDPFIEGVHFSRKNLSAAGNFGIKNIYKYIGKKAITINVSDILACGGVPKIAFVSLAINKNEKKLFFDGILSGLFENIGKYGIFLGGGDISNSPGGISVVITLIGTVKKEKVIKRSGTNPGEYVYLSAPPGESALGLELLRKEIKSSRGDKKKYLYYIKRHIDPEVDIKKNLNIIKGHKVTAMTDSSDGLYRSLEILCENSGCGMRIDLSKIPARNDFSELAGSRARDYILFGGEDYLPVFTSKEKHIENCFNIGSVTEERGIRIYNDEKEIQLEKKKMFDHFSFKQPGRYD